MFEAGLFVETFLPLFMLSAYKNSVHCKSIVILVNNRYGTRSIYSKKILCRFPIFLYVVPVPFIWII